MRSIFQEGQNLIGQSNCLDPALWVGRYMGPATFIMSSGEIAPNGKPEAISLLSTSGTLDAYLLEYLEFQPNKYYTASVWARWVNEKSSPGFILRVNVSSLGVALTDYATTSQEVNRNWKRYYVTIFTSSLTSAFSTWVVVHNQVSSGAVLSYWGLSVTETDTLYPYVPTSTEIASDPFYNLVQLDPSYKSKYNSKNLGNSAKTISGAMYEFGKSSTEAARLQFDNVSSAAANGAQLLWQAGTPVFVSDGVYPEAYRRKITNATIPAEQFDAETSDKLRLILDLEKY